MPNPVLNDKTFRAGGPAAADGTWAPPSPATAAGGLSGYSDGPISPYTSVREGAMTVDGAITATGVLFAILLVGGAIGWALTPVSPEGTAQFPAWLLLPMLAAFGVAIFISFKPTYARIGAPIYAILQGMVLGAISRAYESMWDGIVLQAIGITIAVFLVMLIAYRTRLIKVTERTRSVIIGATLAIMVFYLVSIVVSLFGASVPFINSTSLWGIGFSVLVAGVAAFNLLLDFDLIERGSKAGAPKFMEWYAGFGLVVTVVWLYLEMLRLLSKIRSN